MPGMQEITVGLRFTADTQQAKAQLTSLKTDLMNLSNLTSKDQFGNTIVKGLNEANIMAAKLKTQLDAATNVKTGNLDLSKFNKQLQMSGTSLAQYKIQLESMGPAGQQAFLQLANSIQSAEMPLIRINKLFTGLWENLKRTAGWQISSTAIHAFMGAIQGAYHYAQDLNESLNNIRIVTGKSIDDMSKFAEQANKAAKSLSTTTKAYTDASLIFYQQGLDGQDVIDRTDVVIKMANVTGQSAETVSDQMTAVWNNFAKGGEDLESFADKMTALGAATASSTDEIAGGLEKFAAVAETVGLSFDYAASALATITAVTRQSEDTVGTALKTIFARLEGLKLGESLEDGTDLNKYSQALLAVGINIKDANGNLKDMDDILDELGAKWQNLARDEQMALAQTVAGTRQYNQLMSLMANWDYFQQNLAVSRGSTGELQRQADIYAESWEAAQKKVKASMESLYSDLIDDEFFIEATESLAKILEFIDKIIDSLGGMPGVLSLISTLIFTIANDRITNSIRSITFDLKNLASNGAAFKQMKNDAAELGAAVAQNMFGGDNISKAQADMYLKVNEVQQAINKNAKKLNETDLEHYKTLAQILQIRGQENIELQKQADLISKNRLSSQELLISDLSENLTASNINKNKVSGIDAQIQSLNHQKGGFAAAQKKAEASGDIQAAGEYAKKIQECTEAVEQLKTARIQLLEMDPQDFVNQQISNLETQVQQHERLRVEEENAKTVEQELIQVKQQLIGVDENSNNLTAEQKELLTQKANLEKELNEVLQQSGFSEEQINSILSGGITIQQSYINKRMLLTAQIRESSNALEELIDSEEIDEKTKDKLKKAIEEHLKLVRQEVQALNQAEKGTAAFNNAQNKILNTIQKTSIKFNDFAQRVTNATRSLSSLAMGFNAIASIKKTIEDSDMNSWDKFTSILMSVSFAASGIIPGLSTMMKTISSFATSVANSLGVATVAEQELITVSEAKQMMAEKEIGLSALKNQLDEAGIIVTKNKISEKTKEAIVTKLNSELTDEEKRAEIAKLLVEKEGISQKQAELIADKMLSAGSKVRIGDIIKETFARIKHTASIVAEKAAMLLSNPVFLATAAAVVLVTAAIMGVIKAREADSKAIATATAAWERSKKVVEETKNKYDEITESLNKLSSAEDKLKNLEEGTKEWSAAVAELNNQILDLIGLYPELAKHVQYVNGRYIISEEGQDFLDNKQKETLQNYQNAQMAEEIARNVKLRTENTAASNKVAHSRGMVYTQSEYSERQRLQDIVDQYEEDKKNNEYLSSSRKTEYSNAQDRLAELAKIERNRYSSRENDLFKAIKNQGVDLSKNIGSTKEFSAMIDSLSGLDDQTKAMFQKYGENEEYRQAILEKYTSSSNLVESNRLTGQVIGTTGIQQEYGEHIAEKIQEIYTSWDRSITDFDAKNLGDRFAGVIAHISDAGGDAINSAYNKMLAARGARAGDPTTWRNQELEDYLNNVGYKDNKGQSISIDNDEQLFKLWLQQVQHWTDEDFKGYELGNGNGRGKIRSAGAEDWENSVDKFGVNDQQMREDLAQLGMAQDLLANANINVDDIDKWVEQLTKVQDAAYDIGWGFGTDFSDAVLSSLSTGEFNLAEEALEVSPEEYQGLMSMTGEAIAEAFEITPEMAEAAGFSGEQAATAWGEAFQEELKSSWSADDYFNNQVNKIGSNADAAGLDSKAIQDYAKYISEAADEIDGLNDSLADDIEKSGKVAVSIGKMNKGIQDLADHFDDAKTALTENAKGTQAYSEALSTLKTDVATMLDVSEDYVDNDFIETHLGKIEQAAKGDAKAIDELQMAMAEEVTMQIGATLVDPSTNQIITPDEQQKLLDAVKSVEDLIPTMEVGMDIDRTEFDSAVQDILTTSGMTAEKAREIFSAMSLDVDFETTTENLTHKVPVTTKVHEISDFHLFGEGGIAPSWTETERVKTDYEDVTEEVEVPKMDVNGGAKVNGITRTRSGATASKPTSKSSSSGGGGGGSSKKPKSAKDEQDRYHEVNKTLETIQKNLDRINKTKDRAFGGTHLAAIRAETQELKEQNEQLKEKQRQIIENLKTDQAAAIGVGAIIDENGHVANYNELIAQAVAEYNASAMEEADEERFDYIKKVLDQAEETASEAEDIFDELVDNERAYLDSKLEEIKYVIDIKLDIDDRELDLLEWRLARLTDKAFDSAKRLEIYTEEFDTQQDKAITAQKGIGQILLENVLNNPNAENSKASSETARRFMRGEATEKDITDLANLDLTQETLDTLTEYVAQLRESYTEMANIKEQMQNELVSTWEEYNEEIEHNLELFDHYDKQINHFKNLIDIAGKNLTGMSAKVLQSLDEANVTVLENNLKAQQSYYNMQQADLEEANKRLKYYTDKGIENLTEDEKKSYLFAKQQVEDIEDKSREIYENILDLTEQTVQAIKDKWVNAANNALDEWEKSITGSSKMLNDLQDEFNRRKDLAELYLPAYKQLYELNKLNRDINNSIDNTDNIRGKEKLRELQQEINDLQASGVELSEYDLNYLQKKYELKVAEIALEEAQNAKNQVRLSRDSNGNYSYIYTANEDNISKAMQDYEDKLYSLQDLTEQYLTETGDKYVQTLAEMSDALRNLHQKDFASQEEYEAALAELMEYYQEKLDFYAKENEEALNNNQRLYLEDYTAYKQKVEGINGLNGQELANFNDFTTTFEDTIVGKLFDDYNSLPEAFENQVLIPFGTVKDDDKLLGKFLKNFSDMRTELDPYITGLETTIKETVEGKDGKGGIKKYAKDAADKIKDIGEAGKTAYNKLNTELLLKLPTVDSALDTLASKADAASVALNALLKAMSEDKKQTLTTTHVIKTVYEGTPAPKFTGDQDGNADAETSSVPRTGSKIYRPKSIYTNQYIKTGSGWTASRMTYGDVKSSGLTYTGETQTVRTPGGNVTIAKFKNGETEAWFAVNQCGWFDSYRTGGYTGEFGNEGRLAVLHEKELVLNKMDTTNMLKTVEIVRELSNIIDLQATNSKYGSPLNQLATLHLQNQLDKTEEALQQYVNIQAEFPGVNSSLEIEKAFNDLFLQASQYANRNY